MNDIKKISSLHSTPEESSGFLLWRVSTKWRSSIEDILKPLNLTHPQFVVLATVWWLTKSSANVSQAEIGRHAGLDPNTTSQILRGLETKAFVARKRSADDRSKYPTLTIPGAECLARALPAVELADAQFFSVLNHDESTMLMKILQKLI